MHDCDVTQERLVDLLFDELEEGPGRSLLEEALACVGCAQEYRSMSETLRVFDVAADAALPAESFWPGYQERLSERMAAEINPSFWQGAAPSNERARADYQITILPDSGLTSRLVRELREAASASQLTWPEFKRDPFGFTSRSVTAYTRLTWRFFSERDVAMATASSFFLVFFIVGGVYALEQYRRSHASLGADAAGEDYEFSVWINNTNIPREQEQPKDGTPGLSRGRGGGSQGQQKRASGGGGGGSESLLPTSNGKHAPGRMEHQIIPPSVRQPTVENPKLEMSASLKGDPLLIPEDARPIPFGNSDSLSTTPSDGPGKNGGQGTGANGGQGSGDGKGYGPGRNGNIGGGDEGYSTGGPGGPGGGNERAPVDYGKIFKSPEVSQRAVITSKPDPGFTEEARKNNVMGVVRLRAVLAANGAVTRISVISGLPDGLTERAIIAAQRIKFQPARKDGRSVSQWITLEYNFNIY